MVVSAIVIMHEIFGSENFQRTKDQTQFFDSKVFIKPKLRDSLISFLK
jgi:hypothetical protein